VALRSRLNFFEFSRHLPRRTVRLRLTVLYSTLFLASGVALLAITYVLVSDSPPYARVLGRSHPPNGATHLTRGGGDVSVALANQLADELHSLLVRSAIALAIMAVVSIWLGWLFAGRVLRPLRTITESTRHISEDNLHERLALPGPRDEVRELGDTIDGLLTRLESAFDSQRHFVANASHELRTPLTVSRAMLQVALADPDITLDSLRVACEEVIDSGRQQEQLVDALLTLARSQQGLDHKEPVDLATVTADVVDACRPLAEAGGLRLDATLTPAIVFGDVRLVRTLVSNLMENAISHNIGGGYVQIAVGDAPGGAALTVTNTGPRVPSEEIGRLLQPFQRAGPDRAGYAAGLGVGLSVVAAIATAHGAHLNISARQDGGLTVEVFFPCSASDSPRRQRNHQPHLA